MSDDLLRDLEDDIRTQQTMEKLRYWGSRGAVILAVALIALGIGMWGNSLLRDAAATRTALLYAGVQQLDTTPAEAAAQLQKAIAEKDNAGTAALAELYLAASASKQGKIDEARGHYEKLATSNHDVVLRDYAKLRLALLDISAGQAPRFLDELSAEGRAFRFTAIEMRAGLALAAKDRATANKLYTELKDMPGLPTSMTERVAAMAKFTAE